MENIESTEKIINLLMGLGFTESEGKVYTALLKNGESTGYEASKQSGVPRSKLYTIMDGLVRKGFVRSTHEEKSTLYGAIPVSDLAEIMKARLSGNLSEIESEAVKLSTPATDERIWHINGWPSIRNKAMTLLRDAKKTVQVQVWVNDLDDELAEMLNKKREELGNVIVVLYDSKEEYDTGLKKYYAHGFEDDKLADIGHRWMTVVTDSSEVLYVTIEPDNTASAINTKNKSMIFFAGEYVIHDAYCLRMISQMSKEVQTKFGEDMEGIRDIYSYEK